jgi:transcriptional regulator with XRE-family HTH domain
MALAQRIRQLRYLKGWAVCELAGRAGISRTALHQIERGRTVRPRPSTLLRIAKVLDVKLDDLVDARAPLPSAHAPASRPVGPRAWPDEPPPGRLGDVELEHMFRILLGSSLREPVAGIVRHSYRILVEEGHPAATQAQPDPAGRRGDR